jgi:acetoin utilization deacetylase AcuC-like enzyme
MTIIVHHDDCRRHDPGPGNPECSLRIQAIMGGLEAVIGLEYLPAPRARLEELSRVHPPAYVDEIEELEPAEGRIPLNEPDTLISKGSFEAALRSAGSVCFAIDQVMEGKAANAFCVVRPPGHHAERALAMGFCLFNNVAVGARHAQAGHGVERVAILDFDVHHGNGTQAIFEDDPTVLYVSSHQMPLYPGSGYADETGFGNILNLPLAPGTGSREFRHAWSTLGLPAVHGFEPDLILLSAGFDAHERDPLAHLELKDEDFRWLSGEVRDLADECCGGRLVSVLEGGYDPKALASASRVHVEALNA